jgi:hypothetical protein
MRRIVAVGHEHGTMRRGFGRLMQRERVRRGRDLTGRRRLSTDEQLQIDSSLVVIRLDGRAVCLVMNGWMVTEEMGMDRARRVVVTVVIVVRVQHGRGGGTGRDRDAEHEAEETAHGRHCSPGALQRPVDTDQLPHTVPSTTTRAV